MKLGVHMERIESGWNTLYYIYPPASSFHNAQADLEMRLKGKEEELQQQAKTEKEQAMEVAQRENEELQTQLEMVTKRDQEHKKQLESVKREMERQKQSTLTTQDVCMLYGL